jgi:hypothetical protein
MKSLIIDQIEVTNNGTVQVRFHKISSDGDLIGNHRTAISPAGDINAQVAAVNAEMNSRNFAPISDADVVKLTAICNAAWTAEVVAAYQAAQAAAEAARNA